MDKEKTDEKGQTLDERIAKRLKKETPKEEPATSVKASLPPLPPSTDVPEGKVIKKKVKTAAEPEEPKAEKRVRKPEDQADKDKAAAEAEKKTRKPRTVKPKPEVGEEVSSLVARIEARAAAAAEKVHKEKIKELEAAYKESLGNTVAKDFHAEEVKKAYAAGLKDGEKATLKSIAAQLKGK